MASKRQEAFRILDETNGNISSSDLADKVGYSSRSGAWKSIQAWEKQRNATETSGTEPQDSDGFEQGEQDNGQNRQTQDNNLGGRGTNGPNEGGSNDTDGGGFTGDLFQGETDNGNGNGNEVDRERENNNSSPDSPSRGTEQGVSVGETKTKDKPVDTGQTSIDPPEGMPNTDPDNWEPFSTDGQDQPQENVDFDDVKNTEDIVNEADDPEERERREEMLGELENNTFENGGGVGLEVDEDLMARLFQMPFSSMSEVTGYDGWELTDAEAETNAELFIAYCEENNVEISTGAMLLMSLSQTVGTRTVGYMRYKKQQKPDKSKGSSKQERKDRPKEKQDNSEDDEMPDVTGGFDPADPQTW